MYHLSVFDDGVVVQSTNLMSGPQRRCKYEGNIAFMDMHVYFL